MIEAVIILVVYAIIFYFCWWPGKVMKYLILRKDLKRIPEMSLGEIRWDIDWYENRDGRYFKWIAAMKLPRLKAELERREPLKFNKRAL